MDDDSCCETLLGFKFELLLTRPGLGFSMLSNTLVPFIWFTAAGFTEEVVETCQRKINTVYSLKGQYKEREREREIDRQTEIGRERERERKK